MGETLTGWVADARRRTLELASALTEERLLGPRLAIVNPPLWELGHVAWFQERWVLRHGARRPPLRADGDVLYDSSAVAHDTRWSLPLPGLAETIDYLRGVGRQQERFVLLLDLDRLLSPEELLARKATGA